MSRVPEEDRRANCAKCMDVMGRWPRSLYSFRLSVQYGINSTVRNNTGADHDFSIEKPIAGQRLITYFWQAWRLHSVSMSLLDEDMLADIHPLEPHLARKLAARVNDKHDQMADIPAAKIQGSRTHQYPGNLLISLCLSLTDD